MSKLKTNPDYKLIPKHMQAGVALYLSHGILPGLFMLSILEGDFSEAKLFADKENLAAINKGNYDVFLSSLPVSSYGSKTAVGVWKKHKGLSGINSKKTLR